MTKKNRKKKNIQKVEEEVAGASENQIEAKQPEQTAEESVAAGGETLVEENQAQPLEEPVDVEPVPQEEVESIQEAAAPSVEADESQDDLMDDLLADVRSSLIDEDDSGKGEKKSSWWNRLVKGPATPETPVVETPVESIEEAAVEPILPAVEPVIQETDEPVEEIDELIKLLESEEQEDEQEALSVSVPVSTPVEQEDVKVDIDELKKQAFTPRAEEEKAEEVSDVRMVALEGEEEVFVEVEARKENVWEERVKAVENALRPYRSYIYYGLAFIGVIMAVMASVIIYNGVKQSLPTPVPTEAANMPYPTTVTLPGGLNFSLGKGALKDGTWDPRGPEWLEGTEICRWVALPWSRPLEAAIRTMNRDDVIELVMSNNDRLSYQVELIQELTPAELQEMDSSMPCLAIILSKQDSEKRWVAIGRP